MDQNSPPNPPEPVQMTSPEEDTVLLAIEALEARTVDPHPRPLHSDDGKLVPAREPVIAPQAPPVGPKAVDAIIAPVAETVTVAPIEKTPPKPRKSATPSEEMDEELAKAPTFLGFQFFSHQKPPRKPFVVVGIAVIIIGIGAAAFFATR